jgi:hypothetical protein
MLDTADGSLAPSVLGRLPSLLDGGSQSTPGSDYLIAAVHHPPYVGWLSSGWTAQPQADVLLAELSARGADAVLAGHAHRRALFHPTPVPEYVVGTGGADQGLATPDVGYLRLTFTDTLATCFVEVPPVGVMADFSGYTPGTCAE